MLEDGIWRRSFIPTVFLWASAQPNFWSIKTEKLLPVLQAIFDAAYPGMNHNVQPKGPIVGLVSLIYILTVELLFLTTSHL